MGNTETKWSTKRTARILTVACGLLFFAFSFVYLYIFQRDVVEALHFYLADGKTQYAPFWTAFILSAILLLLRWGINVLMGLKGPVRALSYFPSCLLLGVLTDVDYSVYQEGISLKWVWLLPLMLLAYILLVFGLRRILRWWLDIELESGILVFSNLVILLGMCLMTLGIGNTNIHFHHELAIESALRKHDYQEAYKIGAKVMDPSRSLTALRAYAMSKDGTMGEYLFQCPQLYMAEGLLLDTSDKNTLRMTVDSLYTYLGEKPRPGERAMPFFQRLCNEETGNHTTLEYYLSALLLDKQLGKFAEEFHDMYTVSDSIPRYYKEALFLYEKLHPSVEQTIQDEAMEQLWQQYNTSREECSGERGEANLMRRMYGNTYWWYYQY